MRAGHTKISTNGGEGRELVLMDPGKSIKKL